jgi:hypothetical protein
MIERWGVSPGKEKRNQLPENVYKEVSAAAEVPAKRSKKRR